MSRFGVGITLVGINSYLVLTRRISYAEDELYKKETSTYILFCHNYIHICSSYSHVLFFIFLGVTPGCVAFLWVWVLFMSQSALIGKIVGEKMAASLALKRSYEYSWARNEDIVSHASAHLTTWMEGGRSWLGSRILSVWLWQKRKILRRFWRRSRSTSTTRCFHWWGGRLWWIPTTLRI